MVKGNPANNEIYYSNSTYFNIAHPMNPIDRVRDEGLFHPLIDAGALTHVWLGEALPSAKSIANFVEKVFKQTLNAQIAFRRSLPLVPIVAKPPAACTIVVHTVDPNRLKGLPVLPVIFLVFRVGIRVKLQN